MGCALRSREGLLALLAGQLFVGADVARGILRLRWRRQRWVRTGKAEPPCHYCEYPAEQQWSFRVQYLIQFYNLSLSRGLVTQLPPKLGWELVRWAKATLFSSTGLPCLPRGAPTRIPGWVLSWLSHIVPAEHSLLWGLSFTSQLPFPSFQLPQPASSPF